MPYSESKYSADTPVQSSQGAHSGVGSGLRDLGSLFSQLGDKLTRYMEYKTELLKSETRQTVRSYTRSSILGASAGVTLLLGVLLLEVTIGFWLSLLFPFSLAANLALGFLIVAVIDVVAGGILLWLSMKRFSQTVPVPQRSLNDLKKDKEWLEKQVA